MSKGSAKEFFQENFEGRIVLTRAARHVLQQSSVRYGADGRIDEATVPEAFTLIYRLLADLDGDFRTMKILATAKKAGVA